jgi:hypothetical protein
MFKSNRRDGLGKAGAAGAGAGEVAAGGTHHLTEPVITKEGREAREGTGGGTALAARPRSKGEGEGGYEKGQDSWPNLARQTPD